MADPPGVAAMIPYINVEVLKIGPLPLHPFGVLVTIGVMLGVSLATRRARRLGMAVGQLRSFISWFLVAGFVGGHVFDSIFYHPNEVVTHPWMLRLHRMRASAPFDPPSHAPSDATTS